MKLKNPIASLVSVLLLSLGMATLATSTASADTTTAPTISSQGNGGGSDDSKAWVWVCKYVGTPGVNETLKDGKQPIRVNANSTDGGTVGAYFNDAQGRSLVLDVATQDNTSDKGNAYTGDKVCPVPVITPPSYVVVVWRMSSYVNATTPTWPQTYVTSTKVTTKDLGALDSWVNRQTYGCFQIDGYNDNQTTTDLIAGGHLNSAGSPPESLWGGSWNEAYKLMKVGAGCTPPPPVTTEVTAVFPEPTPATCTIDGALPALPTDQTGITFRWDKESPLTMVATALTGYVLTGDTSRTYTEPGKATGDCYVPLKPVTVAPATCQVGEGGVADVTGGSITLPSIAGVTYTVTGGTSTGLTAGEYVVTATPAEGTLLTVGDTSWTLQENGTATITVTVAPATNCSVPQPDPKVTTTDWVDGTWGCNATTVKQTRTVTTTPYAWGDGNWVLDTAKATAVTETRTRALLTTEQTVCDVLAAPPNVTVTPRAYSQVLAAAPNATTVLAATGATPLPLALMAMVLIGAGVVLQPRVRRALFTRR